MIDFSGRKGMQRMCADASFRARKRSTTVFISARRASAHCALAPTSRSRDSRRTVYVFVYVRAHAFVRACARACVCLCACVGAELQDLP